MSATAMRTAVNAKSSASEAGGDVLRRSCACGTCNSCAAKKSRGLRDGFAPPSVHDVLRAPGRPLDSGMRGFMEQRFAQDFSGVRVHADGDAASSAAAVQARAYTVGEHIVLGDRARSDDKRLHAHELAHVVQQRASGTRGMGRLAELEVGSASDPAEAEADRMAGEALRGSAVSKPARHPSVLRRDGAPPSNAAPAESKPAPAEAKPAAADKPSKPETQLATNVDLGRMGKTARGRADAVLHRTPAAQPGQEQQPCEIELILKLHFDFHLGSSTAPGGPWPADRAAQWKRDYMTMAQETWSTDISWFRKTVLERSGACEGEPCTQAVGHLRVIDTGTMTDLSGNRVNVSGLNSTPHYSVNVYEYRPQSDDSADQVQGNRTARFYTESVKSKSTQPPPGFDTKQYKWSPGGAPHETGHMLGRPHDKCGPDADDPNKQECYGDTVMGHGTEVTTGDLAPFLAGMRAITGCEWKVSSNLRLGRVLGIIGGALALAGGIGLGVYLGNKK